MAISLLVAWDGFLRVGELVQLVPSDIAFSLDSRLPLPPSTHGALRLRSTKTGPNRFAVLCDPRIAALLRQLVARTRPAVRVFPFSADQLRHAFRAACEHFGLSAPYTLHSIRHGAATAAYAAGASIETVLERGRWASTSSARTYLQAGKALLLAHQVPPHVVRVGAVLSRHLLRTFSLPQSH
jgi:integrase